MASLPDSGPRGVSVLSAAIRRGDVFAEKCPSREILKHATSRWGVLLLVGLQGKPRRFSELRRKVDGISEKMLAQTLRWLESDGFVERIAYPVVPPHVEYRLTPLGRQIARRVGALVDWIETRLPEILEARSRRDGGRSRYLA